MYRLLAPCACSSDAEVADVLVRIIFLLRAQNMSCNRSSAMKVFAANPACDVSQLRGGRNKLARCPSKFAPQSSRCSAAAGSLSVEMPGGVFWLDKSSHSSDVVYGEVRSALPVSHVMSLVGLLRKAADLGAPNKRRKPLRSRLRALLCFYTCAIST